MLFLAFVRYQQNHHQKVFNWEAVFVQGDWHSKIWQKMHWFIVFHISNLGDFSFWGLRPPKPPWRGDWFPTYVYFENCITIPCQLWHIGLLDAQQWLQRLTFDSHCDEQLHSVQLLSSCSGVASPKIWGAKMFDFRRITLFCLEKRLSKHKMAMFSKHFGGTGPRWSPLARPMPSYITISINALVNKSVNHNHIWTYRLPLR